MFYRRLCFENNLSYITDNSHDVGRPDETHYILDGRGCFAIIREIRVRYDMRSHQWRIHAVAMGAIAPALKRARKKFERK